MARGAPFRDPRARFWAKVNKNGPVSDYRPDLGACWLWTASATTQGYGRFGVNRGGVIMVSAHRWAYETEVGPIPEGYQVDHLCRVTACVNPAHLEPVAPRENLARSDAWEFKRRKTHCPQGHPYDAGNTYSYRGARQCLTCRNARDQGRERHGSRALRRSSR